MRSILAAALIVSSMLGVAPALAEQTQTDDPNAPSNVPSETTQSPDTAAPPSPNTLTPAGKAGGTTVREATIRQNWVWVGLGTATVAGIFFAVGGSSAAATTTTN